MKTNIKTHSLPYTVSTDLTCDPATHGMTIVVNIEKSWPDARSYCQNLGMDLIAIETEAELNCVLNLIGKWMKAPACVETLYSN